MGQGEGGGVGQNKVYRGRCAIGGQLQLRTEQPSHWMEGRLSVSQAYQTHFCSQGFKHSAQLQ